MRTVNRHTLLGEPDQDLTGIESQILRVALGLERRHIARFAVAMGCYGGRPVTVEKVTEWEKSQGRGYPADLREALENIESAVDAWVGGTIVYRDDPTIYRPLGARRAFAALDMGRFALRYTEEQLRAIDLPNGEFWAAVMDAAIARACWALSRNGAQVRVVLDRQP